MRQGSETTKILVAGGCHVIGYPIGEENSFVRVASDHLKDGGVSADFSCLSYLSIKHVSRLEKEFESGVPDVLVLQLGNFETTVTYRAFLRRILGLKPARASRGTNVLPPSAVFSQTAAWKAKCALKLLGDVLLFGSLIDMTAVREHLRTLLDTVTAAGVPDTIVLSPLACADPLYMRYRRKLARIFEVEARQRGFVYVDLIQSPHLDPQHYVDGTHLNGVGQRWVGKAVAQALLSSVRGMIAKPESRMVGAPQ